MLSPQVHIFLHMWGTDAQAFQPISMKTSFQMCVYQNSGKLHSSKRAFKQVISKLTIGCISTNRTSLWCRTSASHQVLKGPSILKKCILIQGHKNWYIFWILGLKNWCFFPQQNAMTTWMIFPDHASGNYWLAMCECDGDTIKAEGREREAGVLMASLNHWVMPHLKLSGWGPTIRPFPVKPVNSFIF